MNRRAASFIVFSAALWWGATSPCHAETKSYRVDSVIGEGRDGKLRGLWRQELPENPIDEVEIYFRPLYNGRNQNLELRFGDGTNATKHRFAIAGVTSQSARWSPPSGLTSSLLTVVATGGEVEVEKVEISFRGETERITSTQEMARPSDLGRDLFEPERKAEEEFVVDDDPRSRATEYQNDRCTSRDTYEPPQVDIEVARIDMARGEFRVKGAIIGSCIESAGYYEFGVQKKKFHVVKTKRRTSENFGFYVRPGKDGEIRVETSDGNTTAVKVDKSLPNVILPRL